MLFLTLEQMYKLCMLVANVSPALFWAWVRGTCLSFQGCGLSLADSSRVFPLFFRSWFAMAALFWLMVCNGLRNVRMHNNNASDAALIVLVFKVELSLLQPLAACTAE